ncbi:PLxRFG domain-containing protein [Paratractidigestivibacter sp.]|uniref:PLxRFG domain-containing protein n=1 Tax=Paratractidigestivibacter sp. TaxID=2847316 RepID=UPI002AC98967|nr:PLxRFG domain-containing protein [Paratractidigestivibacter sp.]
MPRLIGAYNWDTAQVNRTADADQNTGVMGDTGTDLKVGVGQLKQASYALGDLVARPFRDEDDETFSERLAKAGENEIGSDAWMAKKNAEYSAARQASEQDYEATKASFGDSALGQIGGTLYGLATNPRAAFGRIVQSAPAMVAGGGVGGAIAKGATVAGLATRAATIARAASIGSSAAEGIQSGANNAYDLINYNMQNGRGRYEGVGLNQAVTALGVGATSLLGAKVGGGIEASIFNKEARQALRVGNKGTIRAIAGEGGEESVQSIWEDVPQNLSMGKPWDEGLYSDMAESGFAGGHMGGGVHLAHRMLGTAGKQSFLDNAPTQSDVQAQAQARRPEPQAAPQEGAATPQADTSYDAQEEALPQIGWNHAPRTQPTGPQTANEEAVAPAFDPVQFVLSADPQQVQSWWDHMSDADQHWVVVNLPNWPIAAARKVMSLQHGPSVADVAAANRNQIDQQRAREQAIPRLGYTPNTVPPASALGYDAPAYALGYDPRVGTRNDQPIDMGYTPDARLNRMTPQSGFDEYGRRTMSNQELNDYHSGNRRAVQEAAVTTPMAGVAPEPPVQPRELTKEEKAEAKAQEKAQKKKDKEAAAFRQAEADADAYHSHYADTLERGKRVAPKEIKEDSQWHAAHPEMASTLQVLARANKLAKAGLKPSELRDLARKHHSENPISMLESLDRGANEASTVQRGDVLAAAAEIFRDPNADMEQFISGRVQARADAEAKKELDAAAAKTQKQAPKADAEPKAEAKPVEEVVPSADEWEKMSEERRAQVMTAASRSKNKEFHDGVRDLNDKFRAYQEKVRQDEEGKKAIAEKSEEKKEEPKSEEKKEDSIVEYEGRRTWKSVVDEAEARPEGYTGQTVEQWQREKKWRAVAGKAQSVLREGHDEVGPRGGVTHVRGVLKENVSGYDNAWAFAFDLEHTNLLEDIQKFATKDHLEALEALEAITRELYYPDIDLGLDKLRAKLGVEKVTAKTEPATEIKSEPKAEPTPAEPASQEEKPAEPEKPAESKPKVKAPTLSREALEKFSNTMKSFMLGLKAARVIGGNTKALTLPDIMSEDFRKKAMEVATQDGRSTLSRMAAAVQKIVPGYTLELPPPAVVMEREAAAKKEKAAQDAKKSKEKQESSAAAFKAKMDKVYALPERTKFAGILIYLRKHKERLATTTDPDTGNPVRDAKLEKPVVVTRLHNWLYNDQRTHVRALLEEDAADDILAFAGIVQARKDSEETGIWAPPTKEDDDGSHRAGRSNSDLAFTQGQTKVEGAEDDDIKNQATQTRNAVAAGRAGAGFITPVKSAYLAYKKQLSKAVFEVQMADAGSAALALERVENPALIAELDKKLEASNKANLSDNIAQAAVTYSKLMLGDGKRLGILSYIEDNEQRQEVMEGSPVGRWLARQSKLVENKLLAAETGREAEVEDSEGTFRERNDAAVDAAALNPAVSGIRAAKHPEFMKAGAAVSAAVRDFLMGPLLGDGGWCSGVDMRAHIAALRKKPRTATAKAIFAKCGLFKSQRLEGIIVPVSFAVQTSKNLRSDLSTIVSKQCVDNIMHMVEDWQAMGKSIPTDVYVLDFGIQNAEHVSPDALECTGGQFAYNRFGFSTTATGTLTRLNTGIVVPSAKYHIIAIAPTTRNQFMGASRRRASDIFNNTICSHEALHREDTRCGGKPGEQLSAAIVELPETVMLRAVSLLGVNPEIRTIKDAVNFLHENDFAGIEGREEEAARLWSKMTVREREVLHHTLAYPWTEAIQLGMDMLMSQTRVYQDEEIDKARTEKLATELYAALGSTYMSKGGPGRATLEKYFPNCARAVREALAYGTKLSNEQLGATAPATQGVHYAKEWEDLPSGVDARENDENDAGNDRGRAQSNTGEVRDGSSVPQSERGRDIQRGDGGTEAPRKKESPEEREARLAKGKAEDHEARIQKAIKDDILVDPSVARVQGIDPDAYETPEGKAVVREYAEAVVNERSARSRVGALTRAAREDKTKEEALHQAQLELHEAMAKVASTRVKFSQFTRAHQKDVHYEPLKPQASEQFPYDKWVNKIKNPRLQGLARNVAASLYKHGLGFTFTRDLVNIVKGYLPAVTRWQDCMDLADQESRTWQARAVAINQKFDKLSDQGKELLNRLMESSAMDGIWYALPHDADEDIKNLYKAQWYDYSENPGDDKWADMRIEDNIPDDVMEVYKDALNWGRDAHRAELEGAINQVTELYRKQIESRPDKKEELEAERNAEIKRVTTGLHSTTTPYFPIRRFGDYVVVVRSEKYNQLWQQFTAVQNAIKGLDEPNPATRHTIRDLRAQLLQMQQNGEDYIVEFAESPAEAVKLQKILQEEHPNTQVVYKERLTFMQKDALELSALLNVAHRAAQAASAGDGDITVVNEKAVRVFSELATQMYIQRLSNSSALKSRLHRRKVAGYSKDMMRAFMTSVSAQARHLGFLKHGEAIHDSVDEMIQQARTSENQAVATTALNEILERIDQSVQGVSPATNAALRTTSAWMLLTNPAFFLQNLTQPLLYSVPYIAPRYGMYRALTSMSKEMGKVAGWVRKDGTLSNVEYLGLTDEEAERLKELESKDSNSTKETLEIQALRKKLTLAPDQVKLLQTLQTRGLLDIGLSQEFGEYNTAEHGKVSNKVLGWTNFLAKAARQVEIVNRASTALVTYNLEKYRLKRKGLSEEEAQAKALTYADHVLYETHGDYSSRNAPRYFKLNTLTRLASQFRKFQLIQLGWMCRMIKQSLDATPSEERAFARRGLMYTMAAFALVTGVRGMPIVGTAMMLMGLAGGAGDDDEDVVRRELINAGVDKAVVDFMIRGLPAAMGLDLSDKLGARNMLLPTPYYDGSYALKGGEDDAKDLLASVLGPTASLFLKLGRAADYAWQGDTYKGVETAMPTGFSNVMKAVRFSTEGISTKGGDVLVPGENFSFADIVTQAIGLPTTEISSRSLRASSMYRHQTAYQETAKRIRRDYQKAVKAGDRAGVRAALSDWARMNQERVMQGFAPNKVSNLTGAVKAQRKRERGAVGGVAADKSNRGFAANLAKMY